MMASIAKSDGGIRVRVRMPWAPWCEAVQEELRHRGLSIDGPDTASPDLGWRPLWELEYTPEEAVSEMHADVGSAGGIAGFGEEGLEHRRDQRGPRRPFKTFLGSKDAAGSAERIIRLFQPHALYVEPFLGGGAVLRRKVPALWSIGVDADPLVIERWQAARWPGVELVRGDGIAWLRDAAAWLPADALVYADPPYPWGTRGRRRYRRELSDADHAELLDALEALPCAVVVSSYGNPLYAKRLAGWEHDEWPAMTRGGPRTEHVWARRSTIARFGEDPRHVGRDFRERERLKRKAARWCAKLERMPAAERAMVLGALIARYADTAGAGRDSWRGARLVGGPHRQS